MASIYKKLDATLKPLGPRLVRAGWASTVIMVEGKKFQVKWTPKGQTRLRQLREILADFGEKHIPPNQVAALRALAIEAFPNRRRKTKSS